MKSNLKNILALFVLSMLAYFNAFGNQFVFDDHEFIANNLEIRDISTFPKFFYESSFNLYRPLRTVLYAATYGFGGLNPFAYHLVGKLLNVFTVCSLYALLVLLFKNRPAAFWGALLFALHPVHTEKVAFITSSYDILGDFLWVSAFACYVAYRRGMSELYLFFSLLLFAFGLFSSETAAVTPMVVILYDLTLGRKIEAEGNVASHAWFKPHLIRWIPFFVILAVYVFIRFSVLGQMSRIPGAEINTDLIGNIVTMSGVVARYFGLLLLPWPLAPVYEVEQVVRPYPTALIVAADVIIAALASALLFAKKRPDVTFSFLWFFVVLSPNLNFIPTATLMAERYIYIPSVILSFFLVIFYLSVQDATQKRVATVFAVIAACYFAGTFLYNKNWKDDHTLWINAVKHNPSSDMAVANLAASLKNLAVAELMLKEASRTNPNGEHVLKKLGDVYMDTGRYDEAEKTFQGISRSPKKVRLYDVQLNIATCIANQGRYAEAENKLLEISKRFPDGYMALNNYGRLLFKQGKPGWEKGFIMAYAVSGKIECIFNLASCYHLSGKDDSAGRVALIGLSADPGNESLKRFVTAAKAHEPTIFEKGTAR